VPSSTYVDPAALDDLLVLDDEEEFGDVDDEDEVLGDVLEDELLPIFALVRMKPELAVLDVAPGVFVDVLLAELPCRTQPVTVIALCWLDVLGWPDVL
jgi:hypothetical protein